MNLTRAAEYDAYHWLMLGVSVSIVWVSVGHINS